ncbi:hypothetical protein G9A89_023584 [Geosiphon pyriformis]|nr:hypothetical protein G9A89_023584 [Geosiphon pyriformis]
MVHSYLHSGNILHYDYPEIYVNIRDLGLCQPKNNKTAAPNNETLNSETTALAGIPITSPFIPPSIAEFIEKCLDTNPKNRPTAKEVYWKLNELQKKTWMSWESYIGLSLQMRG